MSFLYNFQQNFKSFRDFQQNFLISLKPIKFDVLKDVSMPDMVIISHIFAFGQLDDGTINMGFQLLYILCLASLSYLVFKKLKKHQEEVRNQKTKKNISAKVNPENQESQVQEVQKEKEVPKKLLTAVSLLILAVNSLFQSVVEALFVTFVGLGQGTATYIQVLFTLATLPAGFFHLVGFFKILQDQIPKERTIVDEEGVEKEWNEATYQADIEKQNSPFKAMFKPYKSKYPYFELVIMFVKGLQVFLTTFMLKQPYEENEQESGNKYAANFIAIVGQALPLIFIIKKQPYNFDGENKVNMFLYIFNIIETGIIVVQGMTDSSSLKTLLIWVIRIIFYVVPVAQALLYKKYGPKQSYNMSSGEKETMKKLEFTAIIELGHKEDPKPMRNWLVFNQDLIDFPDVRNKVWQNYWNNSFQYLPQFSGEHQEEYNDLFQKKNFEELNDKYPKFICDIQEMTAQKRLVENRKIWNKIGEQTYKKALEIQNNTKYLMVRQNILLDVQEQDVHDGQRFGNLEVCQFPFIGLFRPDNADQATEYEQYQQLDKLSQINCTDHRITVLKMKRKCFRTLNNNQIFYPHINYNESKKTVGSGRASQDYVIHGFLAHNYGKGVYGHTNITLILNEGQGADVETNTESGGISQTLTGVDNNAYANFPASTHHMMNQNKDTVVRPYLPQVYKNQAEQRKQLTEEYYAKQKSLSYHFNANILSNKFLKQEKLQELLNIEQNPKLNEFMKDEYSGNTYKKTISLAHDASRIYQHYFYSDVWKKNYDVKSIKKKQIILDPSMQDFIGYEKFKDREEHEQKLTKEGLKAKSKIKVLQKFFNNEIMDNYYELNDYFVDKFGSQFKQEDPIEVVENEKIIEYLKNPKTTYEVDTATEQEKDQYIESFKAHMQELFQNLIQRSRNFWAQAENTNNQQIREYETKKRQTEDLIKRLERDLQQAQQKLNQAQQQLRSAESAYNSLPQDHPQRSSAQSKVSSARSAVQNAESEVRRIQEELNFQREVLANIIEVLKRVNFNKSQYQSASNMTNSITQGGFKDYNEFVEHYAKNIYVSLTSQASNPANYTRSQLSNFNVVRR